MIWEMTFLGFLDFPLETFAICVNLPNPTMIPQFCKHCLQKFHGGITFFSLRSWTVMRKESGMLNKRSYMVGVEGFDTAHINLDKSIQIYTKCVEFLCMR